MKDWSYKKKVLILIAVIAIVRLFFAFNIELTNDESYYWFYSQHLKLNYFDHPPMIAYFIRIFTLNLSLQNIVGFVRLSSIVSCCIATWFIYKCVATLSSERVGFIAAYLYNASFYAGITAGIYAMPDSPQMIFWSLSLYVIVLITQQDDKWKYWLLLGIATGLCIMSKVHGIFIWIGLGCYAVFYKRSWLLNIKFYTAILIAVIICLPILYWNIYYNFITYKFNGPRIDIVGTTKNWIYFRNELSAQTFYTNPVSFVFIALGLIALARKTISRLPALAIFNFTGVTMAVLLLLISTSKSTLAHWSGPAYVTLFPLAAIYIDQKIKLKPVRVGVLAFALHVATLFVLSWIVNDCSENFGSTTKAFLGMGDKSLDMYGWKTAGEKFDSVYTSLRQQNKIPERTPLICNEWGGAHVEYYFCLPLNLKMIGLGDIMMIHEYMWMNDYRKDSVNMNKALCVVPSDEYYNVKKAFKNYYTYADSIASIPIYRGGKPMHNFYVYELSGWKNNMPIMK